ncbi:MAG: hypothetical protein RIQ41_322 [Candidatus Parcubacteria bacterium]|jgi:hypothetical protein
MVMIINVYVAHPIGGDVAGNVLLVERRCEIIFKTQPEIQPLAPYLMALKFLDDNNPTDRLRGVSYNREFFKSNFVDEVWLFGNRLSAGMWQEVLWAREFGIPVIPMTRETQLGLIEKEISIGLPIQIGVCGPGQRGVGIYRGEIEEGGRVVGLWVEACGRLHDLYWGDICHIHPVGVPIESGKRRAH